MKDKIRFIGLDVHKETIMIAIAESQGGSCPFCFGVSVFSVIG